jgi:hypothetical protein
VCVSVSQNSSASQKRYKILGGGGIWASELEAKGKGGEEARWGGKEGGEISQSAPSQVRYRDLEDG